MFNNHLKQIQNGCFQCAVFVPFLQSCFFADDTEEQTCF